MIPRRDILDLADRIVREFDPQRLILFGSYAYGTPTADSDVDLLVILPFAGRGLPKSVEILNRVRPAFAVDLIARQPEDTTRRYAQGDPLIREALDRGQVLYERSG